MNMDSMDGDVPPNLYASELVAPNNFAILLKYATSWKNGTFAQYPLRKRSLRNGQFAKYTLRSWTLRGRTLRGRKLRPTNTALVDTSRTKNVKIFFKTHNCQNA